MMFILRTDGAAPEIAGVAIKMTRRTPALAPDSDGKTDFFCSGDPETARALGWSVVPVHDGWYADDTGGGVAIWAQGMFWEVRDTPFTVKEADDGAVPSAPPQATDGEIVNVRGAIFGV